MLDHAAARPAARPQSQIALHHVHLVGDQQDGQAELAVEVAQQASTERWSPGRARRSPRRTAAPRVGGQRAGDAHALLLAAGELRGIGGAAVGEADEVEQLLRAAAPLGDGRSPTISSGSATFPAAVREVSRLKCWKIIPIRRWRRAAAGRAA